MLEVLAISVVRSIKEIAGTSGSIKLRELLQYLGHLIAALSAADIDDNVGIGPFGDLMLGHGFSVCRNRRASAAVPPLAMGNRVSRIRCPVISGLDGRVTLAGGSRRCG